MSNNIDLKKLWNKQESIIPETRELFEKVGKFKKTNLRKLVLANVLLLSTSAFIVFIWYYYQPKMITTKIGIVLILLAMALYLFVYNRMIPILMKVDYKKNSSQYLQQLLKLKEKQLFLQTTMMNIYFIFLSTGIGLYMFEYTSGMTFRWATIAYGITLIWIVVNWIYFLPKTIRKQQAAMNDLIDKFEGLSRQITAKEEG